MARFVLLFLALLSGACSYSDLISSTPEEKRKAFAPHRSAWKHAVSPSRFALQRSVQVFDDNAVVIAPNKLSLNGTMGMGALISADGYALTAAHVSDRPSQTRTILATKSPAPAPVLLQWTTWTIRDRHGEVQSRKRNIMLYSHRSGSLVTNPVSVRKASARVVAIWPRRDLALLKLPIETDRWFEIRDDIPPTGTILFAPGNSATPYSAPSAGRLTTTRVETTRNGQPTTRESAFEYYDSGPHAGLLRREIIEPNRPRYCSSI